MVTITIDDRKLQAEEGKSVPTREPGKKSGANFKANQARTNPSEIGGDAARSAAREASRLNKPTEDGSAAKTTSGLGRI